MFKVKVLKSFSSAHEAVNWMTQKRIEGASIEVTGTLKSIGHSGAIPSGNYHVVLKDVAANQSMQFYDRTTATGFKVPAKVGDENVGDGTDPDSLRHYADNHPNEEVRGAAARLLSPDSKDDFDGHLDAMGTIQDAHLQATNEAKGPNVSTAETPKEDTVMQSISRNDFVKLVTKSVIDVLKDLGMGVLSREALRDTQEEFNNEAGRWGATIDPNRIPQAQEAVNNEAESLLARRPGDETRAARVGKVREGAQRRLDEADEVQNLITDPDGGEPKWL